MSAVTDEQEYAAGVHQGCGDHLTGRPHRDTHKRAPRFRVGYQDGWDVAPRIAAEAAGDRALLRSNDLLPEGWGF